MVICVVFKFSRDLTGLDTDSVFSGMSLPPSQSLYYTDTESDNGVALLEQCIIDIFQEFGALPITICGDLYARTGGMNARDVKLLDDVVEDVCDEDIIDDIDIYIYALEVSKGISFMCMSNLILLY